MMNGRFLKSRTRQLKGMAFLFPVNNFLAVMARSLYQVSSAKLIPYYIHLGV